jgi:RNA polymerase sigma-70 factor (ECF subfamily)
MTEKTREQIDTLVERAQKGSQTAFGDLYDYFYPKIFRYTSFKVLEIDRDDMVSDIFLKFVKNLKKYRKKEGISFDAWLYRMAHNAITDFYRKKSRTMEVSESQLLVDQDTEGFSIFDTLETDEKTPQELLLEKESFEAISTLINSLNSSQREILQLKFMEDFSNQEIAKITGKSEGNIRIIQLRALRTLKEKLNTPIQP